MLSVASLRALNATSLNTFIIRSFLVECISHMHNIVSSNLRQELKVQAIQNKLFRKKKILNSYRREFVPITF
jgi:hypothetical protein